MKTRLLLAAAVLLGGSPLLLAGCEFDGDLVSILEFILGILRMF